MKKVDILQVFINTSSIFGIGLLWYNFNDKVYKTLWRILTETLSFKKKRKHDDGSLCCFDEDDVVLKSSDIKDMEIVDVDGRRELNLRIYSPILSEKLVGYEKKD